MRSIYHFRINHIVIKLCGHKYEKSNGGGKLIMLEQLLIELNDRGAHMIRSLDISSLPSEIRRGLDYAIVYTIPLHPQDKWDWSTFDHAEKKGEALAKWLTQEIISLGYEAYPHTLENVFNSRTLRSPLPNKTLAVLAGLGWIAKNALLISPEYGSALSIAAVLTSIVLPAQNMPTIASRCGDCTICQKVCTPGALKGQLWKPGLLRKQLLDAPQCTECFQCLAQCPWTQRYHQRCTRHQT